MVMRESRPFRRPGGVYADKDIEVFFVQSGMLVAITAVTFLHDCDVQRHMAVLA